MPQNIKIQINPDVLTWAREEAGYTPEDIAGKLHIPTERYLRWENSREKIPLGMIKRIANYYKRQLAVFLLPTPPPKTKKPNDYRNLAISQTGLSPEILIAMRRANKYLALTREIQGGQYWIDQYNWQIENEKFKLEENSIIDIRLSDWLRKKLKINIDEQKKFRGSADAFRKWRNSIEHELSIFIFQFDMPVGEVDGFCYAGDNPPYAIVINKNIAASRKIFTLFHELAHIFKHQSGICLTEFSAEGHDTEFECNNFAGKFLVPDNEVVPISNMEELSTIAHKYKVSREVYLRRNLERNFINKSEFFRILHELRELTIPPKKIGGKIRILPPVTSKNTRGEKFYNLILNAAYNNQIDYFSASDALGMGYSYIVANE
jgi:Zn-dependent peptidase ImmA (M78 family)